eukprot:scaffold6488_cov39-Cyclotella_meneghiniana.AAC.2
MKVLYTLRAAQAPHALTHYHIKVRLRRSRRALHSVEMKPFPAKHFKAELAAHKSYSRCKTTNRSNIPSNS